MVAINRQGDRLGKQLRPGKEGPENDFPKLETFPAEEAQAVTGMDEGHFVVQAQ